MVKSEDLFTRVSRVLSTFIKVIIYSSVVISGMYLVDQIKNRSLWSM